MVFLISGIIMLIGAIIILISASFKDSAVKDSLIMLCFVIILIAGVFGFGLLGNFLTVKTIYEPDNLAKIYFLEDSSVVLIKATAENKVITDYYTVKQITPDTKVFTEYQKNSYGRVIVSRTVIQLGDKYISVLSQ